MVEILETTSCLMMIIGIAVAASSTDELKDEYVPCKTSDPKLGECLKTNLQNNLPYLIKGVPSIKLIPIDPFRVTSLKIDQDTGPVSVNFNFRDLDINNLGTLKIIEIDTDMDGKNIVLDVDFEKPITLDGYYDVKGKIMILPIAGNGKCKISLDDMKAKMNLHFTSMVKNENTYMEIQDLSVKFTTSKVQMNLDNLFNGDKALGNNMNKFLNENWKDILGELQSSIENALVTIIAEVVKPVLNKVPMKLIFND